MLTKKKKILILSLMVVLLVATGIVNVLLNSNAASDDVDDTLGTASDYFVQYRTERLATRTRSLEILDEIIANASSTDEQVAAATQSKLEVTAVMEKELVLEGLIKAFGFEDCVVTMSTNNINVMIKLAELEATQVAQILNTIVTETGADPLIVNVIPVGASNSSSAEG